jgi:hypothetical protein
MQVRSVAFAPLAAQQILRLDPTLRWQTLEAIERVAEDPYLLDLREEDGETFIVAGGYAVFLDVDDARVDVLGLRKLSAS